MLFRSANPFSDRWDTIWYTSGSFSHYKAWEFNGYKTHDFIEIDFNFTTKGDHAGLQIMIGLLGYAIEYHVYDTRHWDYENNTWEVYEENGNTIFENKTL